MIRLSTKTKYALVITIVLIGVTLGIISYASNKTITTSPITNNQSQVIPTATPSATPYIPKPLTLDSILDDDNACQMIGDCWTLVVTGDIMLGRAVNARILTNKTNVFAKISPLLQSGTLTITNLETTLLEDCSLTLTGMRFCADAIHGASLKQAGVDLVSIANNHTMTDYFIEGKQKTIEILRQNQLIPIDQYQPTIINATNKHPSLAFIGIDAVIHPYDDQALVQAMRIATESAQIVIPFFSWGVEYVATPSTQQRELAKRAQELGADVVLGNHPHWVQGVELIDNTPVIYSHGNTIFDQMWSQETREGVISELKFHGTDLIDIIFHPIYIDDEYSPYLLDKNDSIHEKIKNQIKYGSPSVHSIE